MTVCPHCLSTRVRLARFAAVDYLNALRLRFPYRCRDCASRFYHSMIKDDRFAEATISHEAFNEAARDKQTSVLNERRATPRSPCAIETFCYPTGHGNTQYLSWIVNLSCGGIKLRTERSFNPGDNVTVRLRNSLGDDIPRKFHVIVVHIYDQSESDKKGDTIVGCQFRHALSNSVADRLRTAT